MKRRLLGLPLSVFVAMTLGFLLLMLGVAWLFAVSVYEREEALAAIPKEVEALERSLTTALELRADAYLDGVQADIEAALADPYASSGGLLLVERGRVILPRNIPQDEAAPPIGWHARYLLERLDEGSACDGRSWPSEATCTRVALARQAARSEGDYAAWLDHRARFSLPVSEDLATTLWALEELDRARALDPTRAAALLRDGVARPDRQVDGFFARLLAEHGRLGGADVDHLLTRSQLLARRYLVRVDDVVARAEEARYAPEEFRMRALDEVYGNRGYACPAGCWIVARDGDVVRGRPADALLDRLEDEWTADGRLPVGADVKVSKGFNVKVSSSSWSKAERVAHERFAMKIGGLAVVALLGIAVFVLAIRLQRRRADYIELRGKLLSAVTHELKTPLASISALAQTLELRLADHAPARDYPARIVASADRLGFLVDNVLSFARLERGAWKPRFVRIAVVELAPWLAAEPAARALRPVDLTVDAPPDLTLVADPDLVRLLLSNLVDNAAKYATAERVRVRLSARADKRGVHLVVSDDGPGLGVRDPARLFDDFARGHVGDVRGTGLGLSICRWVVALHGGAIRVAATGPEGTTFEATFPHRAPAADHLSHSARAAAASDTGAT